ncbi:hypothetical protein J3Q64DRAFT_1331773 [Phycomyces blakesleeanus]|uniref:Uncharacterized protein n=1 Tax=Phycomyces blakesleeanus TaxID=4837 RepID=A0ABR3B8G3_PHYBL
MTQREQKNILEHQGPSKPLKKSWELLFGSFANSDPIATQNQDEDVIIISDDDDDNDDTMDDTMDNECEIALENPTETPPSPDTTDSNMETSNTDVESNYTDALNDMDSSSGDIEFYDCVMELNNNNVEVADKNSNNSRDFEISEDTTGTTDDYIEISDDEEDTIVNQNNEGDDDSCVFLYENITQQRLSHIQEDDVVDITEKMKIVSKAKAKELDRLRRSLNVIETSHHKKSLWE